MLWQPHIPTHRHESRMQPAQFKQYWIIKTQGERLCIFNCPIKNEGFIHCNNTGND